MKPGIQSIVDTMYRELRGQRVGLLSHQAAVTSDGTPSIVALRACGVDVAALFGPEHGYDGTFGAGEPTRSRKHPLFGIPEYSLYGRARAPQPHMLKRVDVLIHDLQDLGYRPYTYLSTLHLTLQAAAQQGIPVWVADRPIPLPDGVDGPITAPGLASFVAAVPVPFSYGMTPAEAAQWMNAELGLGVDLRTVPMSGYARDAAPWQEGVPWIPPSPGIVSLETAQTYPATVFSEAIPRIDCGRSSGLSFQLVGAPWIDALRLKDELDARRLAGVAFHPHRYIPRTGPYAGRALNGLRIRVTQARRFRPVALSVHLIDAVQHLYGIPRVWRSRGVRRSWFDALYGVSDVGDGLRAGAPAAQIVSEWSNARRAFMRTRKRALLYPGPGR